MTIIKECEKILLDSTIPNTITVITSMEERYLSPKDLALAIGVSESSLKRWIDLGHLHVQRTSGGHRRIPLSEAIRFIREQRHPVQRPELLGLSGTADHSAELTTAVRQCLETADVIGLHSALLRAYLGGTSLAGLCDGPLRLGMQAIGELYKHGPHGIAVEHAATETAMIALVRLHALLAPPPPGAPLAIGGATGRDPYLLASLVCSLALAECGWRTINLGPMTPGEVLADAVQRHRPRLVWRACNALDDPEALPSALSQFAARIAPVPLVVGGRALTVNSLEVGYTLVGGVTELAAFARGSLAVTKA